LFKQSTTDNAELELEAKSWSFPSASELMFAQLAILVSLLRNPLFALTSLVSSSQSGSLNRKGCSWPLYTRSQEDILKTPGHIEDINWGTACCAPTVATPSSFGKLLLVSTRGDRIGAQNPPVSPFTKVGIYTLSLLSLCKGREDGARNYPCHSEVVQSISSQ
jgi:hypothetical protein